MPGWGRERQMCEKTKDLINVYTILGTQLNAQINAVTKSLLFANVEVNNRGMTKGRRGSGNKRWVEWGRALVFSLGQAALSIASLCL